MITPDEANTLRFLIKQCVCSHVAMERSAYVMQEDKREIERFLEKLTESEPAGPAAKLVSPMQTYEPS
jgi:hypothetical protein